MKPKAREEAKPTKDSPPEHFVDSRALSGKAGALVWVLVGIIIVLLLVVGALLVIRPYCETVPSLLRPTSQDMEPKV